MHICPHASSRKHQIILNLRIPLCWYIYIYISKQTDHHNTTLWNNDSFRYMFWPQGIETCSWVNVYVIQCFDGLAVSFLLKHQITLKLIGHSRTVGAQYGTTLLVLIIWMWLLVFVKSSTPDSKNNYAAHNKVPLNALIIS